VDSIKDLVAYIICKMRLVSFFFFYLFQPFFVFLRDNPRQS